MGTQDGIRASHIGDFCLKAAFSLRLEGKMCHPTTGMWESNLAQLIVAALHF